MVSSLQGRSALPIPRRSLQSRALRRGCLAYRFGWLEAGRADRVKLSKKQHIAVPSAVRKQLGITSGDALLVDVRGGYAVLLPEPQGSSQRLRGLHRDIWEGVEPQESVRQARAAWQT